MKTSFRKHLSSNIFLSNFMAVFAGIVLMLIAF